MAVAQPNDLPNFSLSLRSYILPLSCTILRAVEDVLIQFQLIPRELFFDQISTHVVIMVLLLGVIWISVPPSKFGLCWRAHLLGCLMNLGLTLAIYSATYQSLGLYLMAISFFHWSEYMIQTVYNPETTTVKSYMLYHSDAYVIAIIASLLEYGVEQYMCPSMKQVNLISNVGITIVIVGEMLRKISMITAKSNFNHHIQYTKDDDHELVTHGVYSLFRHPAYVGWFLWSVGTQILLGNAVCVILFAFASWRFFSERVYEEEQTLITFFGDKYIDYQKKVSTGLPFISGYKRPHVSEPITSGDRDHSKLD